MSGVLEPWRTGRGKFTYDKLVKADFDDRTLWHLQAVIGNKVRRGEWFHFSWKDDNSIGDGSSSVWIHPNCSLVYQFYSQRRPPLNRGWVDALMRSANLPLGLSLIPEPPDPAMKLVPLEAEHPIPTAW